MARVVSNLPSQPELVVFCNTSITFSGRPGKMVSEEIPVDLASHLAEIRGYEILKEAPPPPAPPAAPATCKGGE